MAIKHCLHERPDGKVYYCQRYSNTFLKENRHFSAYLSQGWFSNLEQAESNINCLLQDDRCDFIHFEQDTINGRITCKSWIIFSKENPAKPSDFMEKPNKHINICPVCGELHLMQGDEEIVYGHCNK